MLTKYSLLNSKTGTACLRRVNFARAGFRRVKFDRAEFRRVKFDRKIFRRNNSIFRRENFVGWNLNKTWPKNFRRVKLRRVKFSPNKFFAENLRTKTEFKTCIFGEISRGQILLGEILLDQNLLDQNSLDETKRSPQN